MKRKHLIISAFTLVALLGAGTGTALAYGGPGMGFGAGMMGGNFDPTTAADKFTQQISHQANLLGMTADEIKSYWAQGKNIQDIIKEKGINETDLQAKMQATRLTEQKTYLQALVDKGAITQAQANARLKFEQDHIAKNGGKMFGLGGGKHGRGMGAKK
ncbi:MAG: hypothetical protein A2261_01660 [Candidatus Magasanikbacteria bacterium RIFOXYA2_FULL_44_8]|uniref:Zinc resistance-associated protein n=1 Tax=Candidatus Magasanikbacteria bacterium RIFOXYA2_FULL_44_8 TaxID=1798696 RepID=A0A1F6NIQ9_9BACT|nr:MAG: hypothetical protein A2261_01660 [Candidatus Magasanikbacteria bacterium RIFOXYA2_FULL_44_8]